MFKVILWDIDGTLLDFLAAEREAIRACFSRFSLGDCTDEMIARYSAINKSYWEKLERGEITKPRLLVERFETFFSSEGIETDCAPAFNDAYQLALGDTICFFDEGYALVKALKGSVRQFAVTNGTKVAQDKKLRQSGLIDLFDGIFISEEVGAEKPSMDFFAPVLAAIGPISKDEILIVGDSLTSDMQGGNNAGIPCCWYNPRHLPRPAHLQIQYEIDNLWQVQDLLK